MVIDHTDHLSEVCKYLPTRVPSDSYPAFLMLLPTSTAGGRKCLHVLYHVSELHAGASQCTCRFPTNTILLQVVYRLYDITSKALIAGGGVYGHGSSTSSPFRCDSRQDLQDVSPKKKCNAAPMIRWGAHTILHGIRIGGPVQHKKYGCAPSDTCTHDETCLKSDSDTNCTTIIYQ